MTSGAYPFLNIAVLDGVRARFAAGDALLLLSSDLDDVIWANGAGAALLGYPDIEAVMGAPAGLGSAARRQIAGTPGFPRIGRDKALLVRLTNGLSSRAVAFLASAIDLPRGENAILLAAPARASGAKEETAARAIAGFTQAGHVAAIVDGAGKVVAASEGFAAVEIGADTLEALVTEVGGERDRLVKRLIPARGSRIPAGIARLTDDPAIHLLVVVDEPVAEPEPTGNEPAPAEEVPAPVEPKKPEAGPAPPAAADTRVPAQAPGGPANGPAPGPIPADHSGGNFDHWYFNEGSEASNPPEAPHPRRRASDREEARKQATFAAAPVRFVWRTDTEGRFSALSEEFVAAMGRDATDVIGRKFRDVARALGFDPQDDIASLLERRDTWSGRSVLWPIAGTDLRVPVDLAALPVYDRDRIFQGFRGFGVARLNEAVPDPDATGLSLGQMRQRQETAPAAEAVEAEENPVEEARTSTVETSLPVTPANGNASPEQRGGRRGDVFLGEMPAAREQTAPEPQTGSTDKIIHLSERRPANEKGLTATERSAFREIAARLRRDEEAASKRTASEVADITPLGISDDLPKAADERELRQAEDERTKQADIGAAPAQAQPPEEADIGEARAPEHAAADRSDAERAPAMLRLPAGEAFIPSAFAVAEIVRSIGGIDPAILARLPLPVIVHSGDVLHFANREFLEVTGYSSLAELAREGGLGALFVDPYDAGETSGGDPHSLRLRTRQGEEFPVEAHLQSIRWNEGKALLLAIRPLPRHAPASVEDIAGPDEAEEALKAEAALREEALQARVDEMSAILDTATDGVVLIAADGTIRSINRSAEALFGFDEAEVKHKPFTSLFAVESQRSARDYLSGLSENGVASVLNDGREVIGREAQGRFIPLFMTIGRLPGDGGFCAVMRDITHWKRAEEELTQARRHAEQASSQKTEFLARVSHEIRTPLNAIIGFSELMLDEKFGPVGNDRYRDYLRDINRSGNHVLDLVNDLLDISKIEAGEQEMNYEAVSLNDTLGEAVAMMQPQANRERVIIRSSFASRVPEVVADLRSIKQIALNLLSNAVRHTHAGGQVIVSTSYEQSGDVMVRVRDNGVGMSQAEIEQAMKPFRQINTLKRSRGDGTGLGLPLTKAMVEANRAKFSINSTPGEGTMVEITFPSTRVLAD